MYGISLFYNGLFQISCGNKLFYFFFLENVYMFNLFCLFSSFETGPPVSRNEVLHSVDQVSPRGGQQSRNPLNLINYVH